MKINKAILHVFDFVACVNTYAQEPMDLSNRVAKSFITRHVRKAMTSVENNHGAFAANSTFEVELRKYFRGETDFTDLSRQVGEYLVSELGSMEKTDSTDLLVVDFEDDPEAEIGQMTDEDVENAYRAKGKHYFAFFLLDAKQAFIHEPGEGYNGLESNTIARHRAILPNPSQKLASYAIIEAKTLDVLFHDKMRTMAGEERMLIPDGLLQCSIEASGKEVFDTVQRVVEYVATEQGGNAAVAQARSKAYFSDNAETSDEIDTWELGEEVFADDPGMQQRFSEAMAEEELPRRVTVKKDVAKKVARNHKIHTDTGIDITFPVEYIENSEFIEFVDHHNGRYTIELKNVGSIENR